MMSYAIRLKLILTVFREELTRVTLAGYLRDTIR
jgi:hypothetical protein